MPPRPRLLSVATVVPPYRLDQKDVMESAAKLFDGDFDDFKRLLPVYDNAAIKTRYSCVPLEWYLRDHGFGERNRLYLENAVALIERAATDALAAAGLAPEDIDVIISVSTTGIATPSLDALLMERLPFRRDVQRLPVFGLGCAGGVLGLGRAAALARATPDCRVLFVVVELCALTFRRADRSKSNVIATALFGDGAAAGVVSCAGAGPVIAGWGEYTWPQSLDIMGWDIADDGFGVLFSRDIPTLVRHRMRATAEGYLAGQNLALSHIDSFVCHPGGAKVIDALEQAFSLPAGSLEHTRSVLRDYGNMSAATVMFVLERALGNGARRHLVSSLGPGFTAGFLTLEEA
ncbi:MAG: type III polyketide synthase [Proteobacteria bacterium]|nr:type III polyketide synthase [Pseudomonadota bacterium]